MVAAFAGSPPTALGSGRGLASKPTVDVCPRASAGSTRRELGRPHFVDTESSPETAASGTTKKENANEGRNPRPHNLHHHCRHHPSPREGERHGSSLRSRREEGLSDPSGPRLSR